MGGRGQQRLLGASVCLSGVGPGVGAACLYLAGAGVGTVHLCVPGDVSADDVGRWGFEATDLGRARGAVLAARMGALNPDTRVLLECSDGVPVLDVSEMDASAAIGTVCRHLAGEVLGIR